MERVGAEGWGRVEGSSARFDDFPSPMLGQEVTSRVESDQAVAACVSSMGGAWSKEKVMLLKIQT